MRNQAVIDLFYNKFEEMEDRMKQMQIDIVKITSLIHIPSLEGILIAYSKNLSDLVEQMKVNALRVNPMILELKGVVSMSRATLDEERKMTEMLEIPALLNGMSQYVDEFRRLLHHMDKQMDRLYGLDTPKEKECEKPQQTT